MAPSTKTQGDGAQRANGKKGAPSRRFGTRFEGKNGKKTPTPIPNGGGGGASKLSGAHEDEEDEDELGDEDVPKANKKAALKSGAGDKTVVCLASIEEDDEVGDEDEAGDEDEVGDEDEAGDEDEVGDEDGIGDADEVDGGPSSDHSDSDSDSVSNNCTSDNCTGNNINAICHQERLSRYTSIQVRSCKILGINSQG